ncbi:MAG TPA: DUF2334 domain-containing protein [Solirubrobacteraceae bacterium]|nr:DUF2334 domain-containing protein [Solirubrobacteraceae bacterium]
MIDGMEADPRRGPGAHAHARDQSRTARLLFDAELAAGALTPAALRAPAVRRATRVHPVPPRPVRLAAQVRLKLGGLDFESAVMRPLLAARRAGLGVGGAAPPRFLVRVDEFPHYQAWDDPGRFGTARFERFHEIMAGAGVPYLLAVLPRVARAPLSPAATGARPLERDELAMLRRLAAERVCFGLHGRDHRTRFESPRRHSELCGLSPTETEELLEQALGELAGHEIRPDVFVAPYNRFDASQFQVLARRFQVVCGGPESIGTMGFHSTPQWRGEAVYLPSYAPFYGRAADVLPAVRRAIEREAGLWVPVVLHWGWEMEAGWADLERLVDRMAPHAASWEDFGGAIRRSGEGAEP